MKRTLWHAGVVFVALGMMFAIVPTGSYSTIAGDRSVSVSVAADEDALVALEGPDTLVTRSNDSTVTLRNNLESAALVRFNVTVGTKSLTVDPSSSSGVQIPSRGGETITVSCANKPGSSNATLAVSVVAETAGATVSNATLETDVVYDCSRRTGTGSNGGANNSAANNSAGGGSSGTQGPPNGTGQPANVGTGY
ncbi:MULTISPECIES: hypothetical protein [Haloferax]|uniref:Uncharacterized protein n=1 Tax=Haloferax marinum TaxID=2666143 RepID=A0A6A8G922_9EURY|nr:MULTISPECIES: hypothetical protein [Haloferax]KAB1198165.1 hypothetical protein Hfx1150_11805 [Haloferax sp. CBA1150]MRW97245.1 hypothetical protein [Haloferax marinum]